MTFIYDSFKITLQNIFDKKKYPLHRCLNLIQGFMNFSVSFYQNNREYINEILIMTTALVEASENTEIQDEKSIKYLEEILSIPLNSLSVMILNIE